MLGNGARRNDIDTPRNVRWRRGSTRWRPVFGATIALSLVILFMPESGVPTAPPGTDKVVHVLLFAALAVTGALAGVPARWLAAALLGYAVGSEVIQASPLLGRTASAADVVADSLGIAIGLFVARWVRRRECPPVSRR
jgi:hypothetical protein